MFITIITFIVVFSVLVLIHEWGHFAAARRAGIKVEEFGLGMPPRAKTFFKDKLGTIFTLNWVPFGGFVRLHGEDSSDPKMLKDKKSFASKTILQRSTVILAGVFMNFLLAWVLISIGFIVGMKPFLVTPADLDKGIEQGIVEVQKIYFVHEIDADGSLASSSLRSGDYIVSINSIPVTAEMKLSETIDPSSPVTLTYVHDKITETINVISDPDGKVGMVISLENFVLNVNEIKYPIYVAPIKALAEVGRLSVLTVKLLGDVVVSIVAKFTVPEGVAGPVGIAQMTHYFVKQGFMAVVQFTALLSISLGVINVMPFPALDGGRFLFIVYEVIARRKPNAQVEAAVHTIGFALLMLLILVITWNDIMKLIT